MRAIFIDSTDRLVYEANITGNDYYEICKVIGCKAISGSYTFENGDYMYIDDQGLFQTNRNGFVIHQEGNIFGKQQIIGNALVVGSDKNGNDLDAVSTIEDIKNYIQFYKFL